MTDLQCRTQIRLLHLADYLHLIVDRLASFDAVVDRSDDSIVFTYAFGSGRLDIHPEQLQLSATAPDAEGLRRLKELLGVAVQLYAKGEDPQFSWSGDLADDTTLASFRLMRVQTAWQLTPSMRRVRLVGDNLGRFQSVSGMHIRMFFPTATVPEPVWPIAGANGLSQWPDPERKPAARVYTIRSLDVAAGWMDVDFVVHGDADHDGGAGDPGIGSAWAVHAAAGDVVGVMGPLGRPVRDADWYVLGCDETGLPALSRILERLPDHVRGIAVVEVADKAAEQVIDHPPGVALHWIHRNGTAGGDHPGLVQAICDVAWPETLSSFGWFAAEAAAAKQVRDYWRETLSYGRDRTLVAGYWKRGAPGLMAG